VIAGIIAWSANHRAAIILAAASCRSPAEHVALDALPDLKDSWCVMHVHFAKPHGVR